MNVHAGFHDGNGMKRSDVHAGLQDGMPLAKAVKEANTAMGFEGGGTIAQQVEALQRELGAHTCFSPQLQHGYDEGVTRGLWASPPPFLGLSRYAS